ncbi:hypothetical protein PGT21_010339 [Puccinia graminis f. sp. tritici]|uniref:Uncharacterized protein n=1 Tax=Puccinia graminis f. sp. tritici TaxID=56615 RepID=A0A5B0PHU1_PUCGR|nr:hypothetical protein PGT21_010339 [Puccinia graminis f. sp. tritici]
MATFKSNSPKCIAFTRDRAPCPANSAENSKWCPFHEELQGKFLRLYKLHSSMLDSFTRQNSYPGFQIPTVDITLEPTENHSLTHITNQMIPRLEDMNKIDDPNTLRIWYQIARRTWALANRAVLAREHHHSQFYQSGDNSHRHFNAILRRKQELLESLMAGIDQRLFQLTIGEEEADWLLSSKPKKNLTKNDSESEEDSSCTDSVIYDDIDCQEEQKFIESPPTPPSSPTPHEKCHYVSEDPDEKLNRRKKVLVGQLSNYLNFPPEDSAFPDLIIRELREVIRNVFRRIIVRDAGLFVRAKEFNPTPELRSSSCLHGQPDWRGPQYQCPIKDFINSDKLSLKELQRLWGLMKFGKDKIGPELIRNAIADIYRCSLDACGNDESQPPRANHKKSAKIWILGGFVWRKAKDGPLSRTGSDHLYAFVSCAGCMLSTCRTFEEWAGNRRLVAVGGRYPEWAEPKEPPVERLFRCFRIVLCRHNCSAKLSKVEKVVPKSKKLRTVYTETQERHYLHLCMSVVDPRSAKIISALSALTSSFNVYAKRRDTKEVTHKPKHEDDLWCSRVRSGYTAIERKGKRFTPATAFKAAATLFEKNLTSPETAFKHTFEDCWDVLVMDAKAGCFDGFMHSIANVILEISGYESIEAAIKGEEQNDELVQDIYSASAPRIQHTFQPNQQPHSSHEESTQYSLVVHRLRCCRSLFREPICIDEGSQPELWY